MTAPEPTSQPTPLPASAAPTALQRSLPNTLTALRLVIAICFFVLLSVWKYPVADLIVSPKHPIWPYLAAAALFGLAAVTDAIDGPLARRWKVVSVFGRVMDPFADKVLVVGAFIMLAGPAFSYDDPKVVTLREFQVSGIYSWMVVIILGRELLVTSIRAIAEQSGIDFSADWSGKAKMILQACVIPFILLVLGIGDITPGKWGRIVIDVAVWLTLIVTVLSGVPYVIRGFRAFAAKPV